MQAIDFKVGHQYRLVSEPGQEQPPPQYQDFVGLYRYIGHPTFFDNLYYFQGIHYLRGKETLTFTAKQLETADFELVH